MKKKKRPIRDFLVSDLPHNRWALWADIVKNQALHLVLLGFLLLLASLPLIVFRYYHLLSLGTLLSQNGNAYTEQVQSAYVLYLLVCLPLLLVLGVYFSGLLRLYKRMSWGEGYFLFADLGAGIKENSANVLLLVFLFWLVDAILVYFGIFFLFSSSLVFYLFQVIRYAIVFPLFGLNLYLSSVYNDPLAKKLFTSLRVFLRHFPLFLLWSLVLEGPLFTLNFASASLQLFLPMAYAFFYFPLTYLGFVLWLNHCFDCDINRENFPQLVDKGLFRGK